MKINDQIINYEINQKLPKPSQDITEGIGGKQSSDDQKVEEKNQAGQDTVVHLSQTSKEVQTVNEIISSEPDVREEKVAELKERIESGNYEVDHKAVADKIVDSFINEIS